MSPQDLFHTPHAGERGGGDLPGGSMPAWQVGAPGEPADVLKLVQVPVPEPRPGQVLLRVSYAALNFPDVLMARGQYQVRPPLPFTSGVELCGEIVALGPEVDGSRIGERVMGMASPPYGSLARYAIADDADVATAPPRLHDDEAACFYLTYQTGWFGLFRRAGLRVGETLVVFAAGGGAGSAAVQIGKVAGARVVAVVGSREKAAAIHGLGADLVVDRSSQNVVAAVKQFTDGRGADVVYDPVGGPAFRAATKMIAFEGRIVVVGFTSGEFPQAAANHILIKNYSVIGLHWGLYRHQNPALVEQARDELSRFVSAGVLRPLIGEHVAFGDVPDALTRLGAGSTVGRLVVATA